MDTASGHADALPPPGPVARADAPPVLINSRVNVVATMNSIPGIRNQYLSSIDQPEFVHDYIEHCTLSSAVPPALQPGAATAIPASIAEEVDEASRAARLYQHHYGTLAAPSRECVRSEFEAISVGALLFLEHLGIRLPTSRHRVPVPGFTSDGTVLPRGRMWVSFSSDNIVRGAAFPGLDYEQLQASTIVALEALATHTRLRVFTIAVGPNEWSVLWLPETPVGQPRDMPANRHSGVGHQALLRVLTDLLASIV